MDSFTLNKIAGAVLGTCLVGMGIGIIAQGIYEPGKPAKPGYALPEPKEAAGGGGGEKKTEATPIAVRLEKADPKKGEADAKVCGACHNFQEGAGAKVGPDLWDVVERKKGSAAGFDYSPGMKAKGGEWSYADLDAFITKPAAYVQGTKMSYPGQEDPEKRAEIIAYLRTLAKEPKPLPKVSEADKKQASAGAAAPKGGDAKGGDAKGAAGGSGFLKLVGESDPKKGQAAAQVCAACHNLKKGAGALIGPDLWNIVNRKKGSVEGFDYSAGLKAKGGEWTFDDLNAWLTKPAAYVPGTKMGYPGEANEKKRAEIIAFLRTLADSPVPVPGTDKGAQKAEQDHKGEAKDMPPEAKPGDQKPPKPPAPPSAPAQPAPEKPEPSNAAGAPTQPDTAKKPDAAKQPDQPAPPPAPEKKTEAAPAAPAKTDVATRSGEGPEPFAAADPSYAPDAVKPEAAADKKAEAPVLWTKADEDGAATAPEPPLGADPSESK